MGRKIRLRNLALAVTGTIVFLLALGFLAPADKATQDYARTHIRPMDAESLAKLINNTPKPILVFFYATWCPYCKEQYKELDTIAPLLVEQEVQKIYIAVDKDAMDVAHFMLKDFPQHSHAETKAFTPYWLPKENVEAMENSLKARKLTPQGNIPYLIVFSPFGKTHTEFHGLTEHYRLSQAIRKAGGQ